VLHQFPPNRGQNVPVWRKIGLMAPATEMENHRMIQRQRIVFTQNEGNSINRKIRVIRPRVWTSCM